MKEFHKDFIIFILSFIPLIITIILYSTHEPTKHLIDCLFYPNVNATGLSNYDC